MIKVKICHLAIHFIRFCLLSLIGFSNATFSQSQNILEDTSHIERLPAHEKLELFIDQYVGEHKEAFHIPGLVVTVVKDDKILMSKGYGFADLEKNIPMTPQTIIRAGSVSKPITATAIIQLVEGGLLELNEPITSYIEELDLEDQFGSASTIAQLLSHIAGYPDQIVQSHAPTLQEWKSMKKLLSEDLPSRVIPPGKVMAYSSWDYALLGYLMEKVTGRQYEEVIAQNLFEPLGMNNSTFLQPAPESISAQLAIGYGYYEKDDKYEVIPHDFVNLSPGVALLTCGEDMGLFMLALLNNGRLGNSRVMKEESISMVLERQTAAHPYSRGRSYVFTELTLALRKVLYHDGNGIGFSSRIVLLPEQNLGLFLSTNHRSLSKSLSSSPASRFLKNLSTNIIKNFTPEPNSNSKKLPVIAEPSTRLSKFRGQYQAAQISQNDFLKLEALVNHVNVKDNRDGTLKIGRENFVEVEPLVFQSIASPSFFAVFKENDKNEVAYLTFGGTGSYRKVKWYEHSNFHMVLFGVISLLFLSMFILFPFTRHGHWVAWVVSLLNLAFLLGVGFLFNGGVDLLVVFKTIPLGIYGLSGLSLISGFLTSWLLLITVRMWKNSNKRKWSKIHFALITMASFVFLWVTYYWNFSFFS